MTETRCPQRVINEAIALFDAIFEAACHSNIADVGLGDELAERLDNNTQELKALAAALPNKLRF